MQPAVLLDVTTDLPGQLERWIEQRTTGRVRNLRVEVLGKRIIVHGRTGSYYVRQLALASVLDALEPDDIDQVELDIDVDRWSFVPQRFDRVEPRRFPGRIVAEDNSNGRRD